MRKRKSLGRIPTGSLPLFLAFLVGMGAATSFQQYLNPQWLSINKPGVWNVCFTPQGKCTDLIVNELNRASHSIKVQAYSFTSHVIGDALVRAQQRGVNVQVILDKSNLKDKHSLLPFLRRASIPIYIDSTPGIAHNKVMIIDERTVLTGSFNFTNAAQKRNAENVVLIQNEELSQHFRANWEFRFKRRNLDIK